MSLDIVQMLRDLIASPEQTDLAWDVFCALKSVPRAGPSALTLEVPFLRNALHVAEVVRDAHRRIPSALTVEIQGLSDFDTVIRREPSEVLIDWLESIGVDVERVGLRRTEAEKQSPLRHRSSVDPTAAAAIVRAIAREASKRPKPPSPSQRPSRRRRFGFGRRVRLLRSRP